MIPEAVCCHQQKKTFFGNKLFLVSFIILFLIALSYYLPVLMPFRRVLFHYVKSIWWAVFLGLFFGGLIEYYVPREYISKILAQKTPRTIFNAVFLGFLMSACSHGILALSIQLHKKGASNSAVVSFLLASPWANFAVTMMLLSLFGPKGLIVIASALIIAVNTGLLFMFLERKGWIPENKNSLTVAKDYSIIDDFRLRLNNYKFNRVTLLTDFQGLIRGMSALAEMVLGWIFLGVLLASLAGAFVPTHLFHKFMGPTFAGVMITLALATVIEVCSEGSSPLAFEIYRQTQALGNSFVFLMAGVVTDYTEIGLLWSNLGPRVAIGMVLISLPQVIILGILFNTFLK